MKAAELRWLVKIHDERKLDELPDVFLPGMLLELTRIDNRSKVRQP